MMKKDGVIGRLPKAKLLRSFALGCILKPLQGFEMDGEQLGK